jgi:hypothetical protein
VHYPDEPYVRKYPRKTLNWHRLGWEGRAVKDAMLGEFDRAGIFDLDGGDAAECISLVTGIPLEVVRIGLERLLITKTFTLADGGPLVWPNYVEGQTCAKSDRVRQAECRARRAEEAMQGGEGDSVTSRHEPSRDVTPNLAQPNSTDLTSRANEASKVEPETRQPRRRRPRPAELGEPVEPVGHWQYPKGWRWAPETEAAAAAAGITLAELRDAVRYWTIHKWPVQVTDLDGELVRSFDGIKKRRAPAGSERGGSVASNPYAWAPTQEHRAFAKKNGLPLESAVDAFRASGRPDRVGTLQANEEFMRHLIERLRPIGPRPTKALEDVGAA